MLNRRKKDRWIVLLIVLAFLAPTSVAALAFFTYSGEHQDEICVPYSSDDTTNLALNASFKSAGTVRIASWNGLFTNKNSNLTSGAREIAGYADVIGVQEMGRKDNRDSIKRGLPEFSMTSDRNAVPIFWRTDMFEKVSEGSKKAIGKERVESGASGVYLGPRSVQWVTLRVKSTSSVITVVNNHIVPTIEAGGKPNGKERRLKLMDRQYDTLASVTKEFKALGPVFVTGDFNTNAKKDAKVRNSRMAFVQMRDMGFLSNWTILGPPKGDKGTAGGGRLIDYVWSTNTTAAKAVSQVILSGHGSDHKPVVVTYKGSATKSDDTKATKPNVSVASFNNSDSGTGDARVVAVNATTKTSDGTPPDNYDIDTSRRDYRGNKLKLNERTLWMLETAERLFGQEVKLSQGSYHHGSLSSDTHDGGGAMDVEIGAYNKSERKHLLTSFRQAGFAAWIRTPDDGFAYHLHAIAIGDKQLAKGAKDQVEAYFNGYDGLWHEGRKVKDSGANVGRPIPDWALKYGTRTSTNQEPAFKNIVGKSYDSGDPIKGTLKVTQAVYDTLVKILGVVYGMKEIPDQYKDKAATIVVATVWIESDFKNDTTPDQYGSIGLFQQIQRYYGAAKNILNPVLATQYFLKGNSTVGKVGLIYVKDWETRDPGEVAQAVQKSGPNDYHKVTDAAARLVSDIKGNVDLATSDGGPQDCDTTGGNTDSGSQVSGQCQTDPVTITDEKTLSMGRVLDQTRLMAQCVAGFFPDVFDSIGTYNGSMDKPDISHPTGKSVDIMLSKWNTKGGNEKGWELARWLRAHKRELGIHIVIFDQKIWNDERNDEGWRDYPSGDDPSEQHLNHVHVEVWDGNQAKCKLATVATCMSDSSDQSAGDWQLPVSSKYGITSPFGMRKHPTTGVYKLHDGDDYGAPSGASIRAIADGTVTSAGMTSGYGNYVTISHLGGKVISGYAHMSRILVSDGEHVKKGQIIGKVGSTGNVTGAHLHANVRVKGYYNKLCPSGGGSKCNGHDDWVPFDDFIKNKDGIRNRLVPPTSVLV